MHFCGELMGGILGSVLTALRPELIRTLTIVATPVFINDAMKNRYSVGHEFYKDPTEKSSRGHSHCWSCVLNLLNELFQLFD